MSSSKDASISPRDTAQASLTNAPTSSGASMAAAAVPEALKAGLPWPHFVDARGAFATPQSLLRPLTLYAFTASWCPASRPLGPTMLALHQKHGIADVDVVHVSLDYSVAENEDSSLMPFFRFSWDNVPVPEGLPVDCENPHWASHWAAVKALGKVGIPTVVVVDAKSGAIVDRYANLVLSENTSPRELTRAVRYWRRGVPASTLSMRARYWLFTYFYVAKFRLARLVRDWITAPLRRVLMPSARAGLIQGSSSSADASLAVKEQVEQVEAEQEEQEALLKKSDSAAELDATVAHKSA